MSPDERRKADAALADLAFNLASDLSSGHFGMPDAVQMIEGLATRLAALSRRAVPMEAVAWRVRWIDKRRGQTPRRPMFTFDRKLADQWEWSGYEVQALAVIPAPGNKEEKQ